MNKLTELVKEKRKALGESQKVFGARFGLSHASISDIERGVTTHYSEELVRFVMGKMTVSTEHVDPCVNSKAKCGLCRKYIRGSHQFFMVSKVDWAVFCLHYGLDIRDYVCADCYEEATAQPLHDADLIIAPINFIMLRARYPEEYQRLKLTTDFFSWATD